MAILWSLQGNLGHCGEVGFVYGTVSSFLSMGHTVGTLGAMVICLFTLLEAPALVAGFDDFALMSEPIE